MRRSIITCLAGIFLAAGSSAAWADCVSACQTSTDCDFEMKSSGECGKTYGAIAYGAQSGAHGWSHGFDDGTAAEADALKNCRTHGDDCQVAVDFWNTCAALARDGGIVASGLGETRRLAEEQALAACEKDGGSECRVQAWSCSLP